MLDLETGCVYRVEFRCRDIGYGEYERNTCGVDREQWS